jgi:hypothetical protein
LPCRHEKTAVDRTLRAPYRSARWSWPQTATAQLPDWMISVCAKRVSFGPLIAVCCQAYISGIRRDIRREYFQWC